MLRRALISGSAGILIVPDHDRATVYKPDGSQLPIISMGDVEARFRQGDLSEFQMIDLEHGLDLLKSETNKKFSLRLILMVLDPEEDETLAMQAACRADELLRKDYVESFLRNQFFSESLPDEVAQTRLGHLPESLYAVRNFLKELFEFQADIYLIRSAFDSASVFLSPAEFHFAIDFAKENGTFYRLAKASRLLYPIIISQSVPSDIRFPEAAAVWRQWLVNLRELTKPSLADAGRLPHLNRASSPQVWETAQTANWNTSIDFSMRDLLEVGAHFGHQAHHWNPKMAPYIFGVRNNIHIIDLAQTVPLLYRALQAVSDTVANGGRVLFVGTKRQAAGPIANAATRSAQHFINFRWLGGMLANWKTISASIQRLRKVDEVLNSGAIGLTKKQRLMMIREQKKLGKALGGIKNMGGVPDIVFVIDTNKEQLAVREAKRLGIPVAAIVDTNCDPDDITYPIPGNHDASRAILFYCDLMARAALNGIVRAQGALNVDPDNIEQSTNEDALDTFWTSPESVEREEFAPIEHLMLLTEPDGKPDDLSQLQGADPYIVNKLNNAGIFHYWQIASMTLEELKVMDTFLGLDGRVLHSEWKEISKLLSHLSIIYSDEY